jgi:L-alanine-DL-glutamate epimerase and related enzymes of enolase superfamily
LGKGLLDRTSGGDTPYDHTHTIVELRTTLLQVPWRGKPPAAGILSAPFRDIYVLEIETQGGLLGMSYLMPLRGGLHTLDACMKELIAPHVIGRDATEIEAIWQTLYGATSGWAAWASRCSPRAPSTWRCGMF